jgi:hypothetical protein
LRRGELPGVHVLFAQVLRADGNLRLPLFRLRALHVTKPWVHRVRDRPPTIATNRNKERKAHVFFRTGRRAGATQGYGA